MMKIIFTFFIFCIVLFLYLHITFHLKTSDDLEIYEIDEASKEKLEEICNLRQPVIFDFECLPIIENTNKTNLLHHYHAFDVKIRNIKEETQKSKDKNEILIPLKLQDATKLFQDDTFASYYTENNKDFLEETGVMKHMQYNDEFLRPPMVSDCNYDIVFGSQGTHTPFRYDLNYRHFMIVTQGSIKIKLSPPKNAKYLHTNYDYENYEFSSPVDIWKPQPQHKADFDKMKCLDIILPFGKTIFIPPYWWYSIEFQKDSSMSSFKYRTYMNHLAILPHTCMYFLQMQNVKRNIVKHANVVKPVEPPPVKNEDNTTSIDDLNTSLSTTDEKIDS